MLMGRRPAAHDKMSRLVFIMVFGVLLLGLASSAFPGVAAEIGSKIANFEMQDAQGEVQSLQSRSGKIVVLFFWSFKCPAALAYAERMQALQDAYRDKGVVVLGVASAANESPREIRANAANLKVTIPILLDADGDLAAELGATHTPSAFVLDQKSLLRYRGAPDNNKPAGDKSRIAYLEEAINALLDGSTIRSPETKPFGCILKRRGFKA